MTRWLRSMTDALGAQSRDPGSKNSTAAVLYCCAAAVQLHPSYDISASVRRECAGYFGAGLDHNCSSIGQMAVSCVPVAAVFQSPCFKTVPKTRNSGLSRQHACRLNVQWRGYFELPWCSRSHASLPILPTNRPCCKMMMSEMKTGSAAQELTVT